MSSDLPVLLRPRVFFCGIKRLLRGLLYGIINYAKGSKKMISDTKNSPEWKAFEEFIKTKEFTDLTRGENAKVKDFDMNSAEKLQELRDVICGEVPEVRRNKKFQSNLNSVPLSKWQVGGVLIERKKYRQYDKEFIKNNPEKKRNITAITGSSGNVKALYDRGKRAWFSGRY